MTPGAFGGAMEHAQAGALEWHGDGAGGDRALVIDDDAAVREVVGELLVALGWAVDVAPDGPHGLARFDPGRHRLVITDLRMPGMSGLEVAEWVRGQTPATAVILMSGMISIGTVERARELGVRLLPKPIELNTLERVVQLALRDAMPA
jgi:two-component system NtrC family response regulator